MTSLLKIQENSCHFLLLFKQMTIYMYIKKERIVLCQRCKQSCLNVYGVSRLSNIFLCFLHSDKSKIKETLSTVLKILMCLFTLLSL